MYSKGSFFDMKVVNIFVKFIVSRKKVGKSHGGGAMRPRYRVTESVRCWLGPRRSRYKGAA